MNSLIFSDNTIPAVSKWLDRSKETSEDGQKNTLILAAQSYAQGNSKILPKVIGQTTIVTAVELKNENYLKKDLKNAKDENCMTSYVKILKVDQSNYKYTPYFYCEGDTIPDEDSFLNPSISIHFSGDVNKRNQIDDVSLSSVQIIMSATTTNRTDINIEGYSYTISVRYKSSDQLVEIYNSGSIDANGRNLLVLEKEPENKDTINEIFRSAHSLKGMAGTMGYKRMQHLTHDMENVFQEVRSDKMKVSSELVNQIHKALKGKKA